MKRSDPKRCGGNIQMPRSLHGLIMEVTVLMADSCFFVANSWSALWLIQTAGTVGLVCSNRKIWAFSAAFLGHNFPGKTNFEGDQDCRLDSAVWIGLARAGRGHSKDG